MKRDFPEMLEVPVYGTVEVAAYLRVPYQTLRYWTRGSESVPPIIRPAGDDPPRLSFINLLECHVLSAMRAVYRLRVPKVRRALTTVKRLFPSPHPLVDLEFQIDSVDLFVQQLPDEIVNLSKGASLESKTFLRCTSASRT